MAANGSIGLKRNQLVAAALTKFHSLDPNTCIGDIGEADDIRSLYTKILKSSGKWSPQEKNGEVMKWISIAESLRAGSKACFDSLVQLNEDLLTKSVILGNGTTPSDADVVVFALVHSSVIGLSQSERKKLPNVLRWMDYVQHKVDFAQLFEKLLLEKSAFGPHCVKGVSKPEVDSTTKKTLQNTKNTEKSEAEVEKKKSDAGKKAAGSKESTQEKKASGTKESTRETKATGTNESTQQKKKPSETVAVEKEELSISLLNIQVGLIRKAWKHPSADSLLVEEIDVGDAKLRQVVSGLAKYCTPDELTNRRVVLITNVKPGKLRDVMSEGLVLCASNEDHSAVEPLLPPEGAKIGECVSFAEIDGKPEDVLNPKKKQLEKITPNLFTDDKGVATFKGIPFMTSGGPCTSSIAKASIK